MTFPEKLTNYRSLVEKRLLLFTSRRTPASLYEPAAYILGGGGKRIRAVLVMLAADAVGGFGAGVVDAAAAVETLHNFTLVHDDIMDRADTRRGRPTIHKRWDEGTAILAGDVMAGLAYEAVLSSVLDRKLEIVAAMTRGIVDVCEGQSLDCDYARRSDVSIDEYVEMITMKTARLLETAAEVGALAGGGSEAEIAALSTYARNIGLAFQIQDDLLDLTADEAELGKKIGGDIIEGKRTYLLVRAMTLLKEGAVVDPGHRDLLLRLIETPGLPEAEVPKVQAMFAALGLLDDARQEIVRYHRGAIDNLGGLRNEEGRAALAKLAEMLMGRRA